MSKKYFRRDDIVGKDIISDDAVRLGKVKDIGYDPNGKIVLIYDKQEEGGEEAIQSSQIIAIGDVVLVKSTHAEKPPTQSQKGEVSLKYCPKCGKANMPDMLFCTSCGTRLQG